MQRGNYGHLVAIGLVIWLATGLGLARAAAPADDSGWRVWADEPRAFGHHVGDVVQRRVTIETPSGRVLDRASLPQVGRRGKSLELRAVRWADSGWFGGSRHTLTLEYQVFLSPPEVRTLEMPPVILRFDGGARTEDLRIDAWPLTLSPIAPADPSPRTGLGALRPEAPAPLIDTQPTRLRLAACAGLALLALAYLAQVYLIGPWWASRHRPFAAAWVALRRTGPAASTLQRQQAYRALHRALDQTAGEVMFEQALPRFLGAHPRFAPLQTELRDFFRRSRAEFFGSTVADGGDAVLWLRQLARQCRDLERGAA